MSGFIHEFFGYRLNDPSVAARKQRASQICPFIDRPCTKRLRNGQLSGVCSVRMTSSQEPAICCPNRLYADHYRMLDLIAETAFGKKAPLCPPEGAVSLAKACGGAVVVFGKGWGKELALPKRDGKGSYYIDWILGRLDADGRLAEITAAEVQTVDTTGTYGNARKAFLESGAVVKDSVGLNWENVSKRITSQLIYKGQAMQRERLCRKGLHLVCPHPVYTYVLRRLGGPEQLPEFPPQPASVTFVAFDYDMDWIEKAGELAPLRIRDRHGSTVYKIQEAFSAVNPPEQNACETAIIRALGIEIAP